MTAPTIQTILSTTNLTSSYTTNTMTVDSTESGIGIAANWTVSTPAAKTFTSGTKATLVVQDLTYTADSVGTAGNSISIEYLDSVKASVVIQDLTYTADAKGSGGNAITVAYTTGGSAGAEVVSVVGNAISVAIQDQAGYSVKTWTSGTFSTLALTDISYKSKLITAVNNIKIAYTGGGFGSQEVAARSGTGTGGDPYIVTVTMQGSNEYSTKTFYSGKSDSLVIQDLTYKRIIRGTGTYYTVDYNDGGALAVAPIAGTGTFLDPYRVEVTLETGVSDADAIKAAVDIVWGAVLSCTVSGTGTDVQTAFGVAQYLTGGVDSNIDVAGNVITTTAAHSFIPNIRVRLTTPGGALPDPLAVLTDYWVESTPAGNTLTLTAAFGGGAVNITDQGAEDVTFSIVPRASLASELETAILADANSDATVARTIINAGAAQATMVATSLSGGVASPLNQTAETVTINTHGYADGNKVTVTGGALPTGLVSPAWIIRVDGNTVKFANSYANAMLGTALNLSSDGAETTVYTVTPVYTTATMIKTAVDASVPAAALVDVAVTGTGSNYQTVVTATSLAGGLGGAAGSEQVVVSSTDIKVYIETGVSTAAQIKTKVDAAPAAAALVDVAVTGGVGGQVVAAHTHLATGTNNSFTKHTETNPDRITIATHGLYTGSKVVTSTGGTLPNNLTATTHYVIKIDANTLQLATSLANALAGVCITLVDDGSGTHTLTPSATVAAIKIQWSVDDSTYEDVPSGYGGESQDMTAATVNMWSINNVQPSYYRAVITQTGGLIDTITIKYTTK